MAKKIAIQGYEGSFHDEAAHLHFGKEIEVVPADTFDHLADMLKSKVVDYAIMAIENSIAGSILQNYRILRENNFHITGEKHLRISHNLMALPGTSIGQIKEIHSHPMALNQCLNFFQGFNNIKLVETEDTALSARQISQMGRPDIAAIASSKAAKIYGLEIIAPEIETHKQNYTRFFILSNQRGEIPEGPKKASIYIQIPDKKGQLLKVLSVIQAYDLNMSKLQSYPVLGKLRAYFFHLDIEFDDIEVYNELKKSLMDISNEYAELGIYSREDLSSIIKYNDK